MCFYAIWPFYYADQEIGYHVNKERAILKSNTLQLTMIIKIQGIDVLQKFTQDSKFNIYSKFDINKSVIVTSCM